MEELHGVRTRLTEAAVRCQGRRKSRVAESELNDGLEFVRSWYHGDGRRLLEKVDLGSSFEEAGRYLDDVALDVEQVKVLALAH